jgi:hypothetical protein
VILALFGPPWKQGSPTTRPQTAALAGSVATINFVGLVLPCWFERATVLALVKDAGAPRRGGLLATIPGYVAARQEGCRFREWFNEEVAD